MLAALIVVVCLCAILAVRIGGRGGPRRGGPPAAGAGDREPRVPVSPVLSCGNARTLGDDDSPAG